VVATNATLTIGSGAGAAALTATKLVFEKSGETVTLSGNSSSFPSTSGTSTSGSTAGASNDPRNASPMTPFSYAIVSDSGEHGIGTAEYSNSSHSVYTRRGTPSPDFPLFYPLPRRHIEPSGVHLLLVAILMQPAAMRAL
jgi:hypothetical protein